MGTINDLAADERTARIILAVASEPGDAVTGRMIRTVGALIGCPDKADDLARTLEDRVRSVAAETRFRTRRPRVYFEEWDDPMISGIC